MSLQFQAPSVEFHSNPLRQYCTVRTFANGLEYILQRTERNDSFMVCDGWSPKFCTMNNESLKIKQALEQALDNPTVKAWVKRK